MKKLDFFGGFIGSDLNSYSGSEVDGILSQKMEIEDKVQTESKSLISFAH